LFILGLRDAVNIDSIEFLAYLESKRITANPELLNELRIYKEQQSLINNRILLKLASQSSGSGNNSFSHNYHTVTGRSKSYDRSTLNNSILVGDNDTKYNDNNRSSDDNNANIDGSNNTDIIINNSINLLEIGGLFAVDEDKVIE